MQGQEPIRLETQVPVNAGPAVVFRTSHHGGARRNRGQSALSKEAPMDNGVRDTSRKFWLPLKSTKHDLEALQTRGF
jgi:hypothetical protein